MTGFPQIKDGVLLNCKNSRDSLVGIARVTSRDVIIIQFGSQRVSTPSKKIFRAAFELMRELDSRKVKINSWSFTVRDADGIALAVLAEAKQ